MKHKYRWDLSTRIYTQNEYRKLGEYAINFLICLDKSGELPISLREVIIDLACATDESPISLSRLKLIILMVLWGPSSDLSILTLDSFFDGESLTLH